MRQSHRLITNAAANFTGPVVRLLIGFVLPPFVLTHIGKGNFGLVELVIAVTNFIVLAQLGTRTALTRFLSEDLVRQDYPSMGRLLSTGQFILCLSGLTGALLIGVVLFHPPWFINVPEGAPLPLWGAQFLWQHTPGWITDVPTLHTIRLILVIIGATVVLKMFTVTGQAIFSALEKFTTLSAIGVAAQAVRLGLVFLLLGVFDGGLIAFIIGFNLPAVMESLTAHRWGYYLMRRREVGFALAKVSWQTAKRITFFGVDVFVNSAAYLLYFQADILLIGKYLDPGYVPHLTLSMRWIALMKTFLDNALLVAMPAVAKKKALGDLQALRQMVLRMVRYALVFTLPAGVFLVVFHYRVIETWMQSSPQFGPQDIRTTSTLLVYLVIADFLVNIASVIGPISVGLGKLRFITISNFILGPLNVALVVLAFKVFHWPVESVGIITIVIFGLRGACVFAYIHKYLNISPATLLARGFLRPLAAAALLAPLAWVIYRFAPPHGWPALILSALGVFAGFIPLAWIIAFDDYDRRLFRDMLGGVRRRLLGR